MVSIDSIAYRFFRQHATIDGDRFRAASADVREERPAEIPGERILGWYVNPVGYEPRLVVLTDTGVRYAPGGPPGVSYADVEAIEYPHEPTAGLRLRLRSGAFVAVLMDGRHGRFRDELEIGRFIRNAARR